MRNQALLSLGPAISFLNPEIQGDLKCVDLFLKVLHDYLIPSCAGCWRKM